MKRKALTPNQKFRLCEKHGWRCAKCNDPGLVIEDFEYDHDIPVGMEGGSHEGNYKPLCPGCHAKKTKRDMFNIAKLNRLERARLALVDGIPKKVKPKITNPGFSKTLTRGFDGRVRERK